MLWRSARIVFFSYLELASAVLDIGWIIKFSVHWKLHQWWFCSFLPKIEISYQNFSYFQLFLLAILLFSAGARIKGLPTVTVKLNTYQCLTDKNDRAFRFFMLNNSFKSIKTSLVFVSQEIRKQKLHAKFNCVNKSHAFRDLRDLENVFVNFL